MLVIVGDNRSQAPLRAGNGPMVKLEDHGGQMPSIDTAPDGTAQRSRQLASEPLPVRCVRQRVRAGDSRT